MPSLSVSATETQIQTASKGSSSREFLVLDSFLLNCISLKAILAEDTDHNPIKPHRKQVLANTEAVPNAGRVPSWRPTRFKTIHYIDTTPHHIINTTPLTL